MEKLLPILNLIGTLILTAVVNRFLSSFRIRQLYLSFDDCMPCYEKSVSGSTLTLIVYNRGKDKEEQVKVSFPSASRVQVISSSTYDINVDGNEIVIDRVLPGVEVKFSIYIDLDALALKKNKPVIKSSDADGKSFEKRGSVPASLGPTVGALSFVFAISISIIYLFWSGRDPFLYYYEFRYPQLIEKGLKVEVFSDNALVAEGSKERPTIEVLPVVRDQSRLVFAFKLSNPFDKEIFASVSSTSSSSKLWDLRTEFERKGVDPDSQPEVVSLMRKGWMTALGREVAKVEVRIPPGQTMVLRYPKVANPDADINSLIVYLNVDGEDNEGKKFKDNYKFLPAKSNESNRIIDLIKETGG